MNPRECQAHRVRMVSSELIWGNKWGYGDPVQHIYTYKCLNCGHEEKLTINLKPPITQKGRNL